MELLDLEGKHLGGYEILRELGRDGMGVVYKTREESLNRMRVEAKGSSMKTNLNDEPVASLIDNNSPKGIIALNVL